MILLKGSPTRVTCQADSLIRGAEIYPLQRKPFRQMNTFATLSAEKTKQKGFDNIRLSAHKD